MVCNRQCQLTKKKSMRNFYKSTNNNGVVKNFICTYCIIRLYAYVVIFIKPDVGPYPESDL